MEAVMLFAQTCLTGFLGVWLFTAARDNLLHPVLNLTWVAEVLRLDLMRAECPEHYARIAHRRITSGKLHRIVFGTIVTFEAAACLALIAAAIWMTLASLGLAAPGPARAAALAGALGFTAIGSAFLIGGNHFAYWYCHQGAQNTHFQMALWGTVTMIFLSMG